MSQQITTSDICKSVRKEFKRLEAALSPSKPNQTIDYRSDEEEKGNSFPNPILVFKKEFLGLARFEGTDIKSQSVVINVRLINYTITFYVNKKLINQDHWEVMEDISFEGLDNTPKTIKMLVALRNLIGKLDIPFIPNLHNAYKAYLQGRYAKKFAVPLDKEVRKIDSSTLPPFVKDTVKTALLNMIKANFTLNSKIGDVFSHSGSDLIITFMLGTRGIGPAEVCFTNRFLKQAKYRLLVTFSKDQRRQALLYYSNSIPKRLNIDAIAAWKRALSKILKLNREKRFRKSILNCIRSFSTKPKQPHRKTGSYKLKFKLLQSRIWQTNFEKSMKRILGVVWQIIMRASAEHKPSMHPPEPPMPQVITHVQNLKREIDGEIQEILHRVRNINDDFKLSQETNNELAKDLQKNSEALDVLRHEMLALALESKEELAAIKAPTHEMNSALGDLRQLRVELEIKIDRLEEEKQKIEKLAKDSIELANKESKTRIDECSKQLWGKIDNMPDAFKQQAGALYKEYQSVLSECKSMQHEFNSLEPSKFRLEMDSLSRQMSDISQSLPNFEYRMAELERTLISQTNTMIEARKLRDELRSVTQETLAKLSKENRLLEDNRKVEIANLRRQGKSHKNAKLAATKANLNKSEAKIVEEINKTVPRIVGFIREWNSFRKGDLFNFAGQLLEIDDSFNPSVRIKECGQDPLKWEAQKFANGFWYSLGRLEIR